MDTKQFSEIDRSECRDVGDRDQISTKGERAAAREHRPSRRTAHVETEGEGVGNSTEGVVLKCPYCESVIVRKIGESTGNYKKRRYCDVVCVYRMAETREKKNTKGLLKNKKHCALACETLSHAPSLDSLTKRLSRTAWSL